MRVNRITTKHVYAFFTLEYCKEVTWYSIKRLTPQTAFFTPKYAPYFSIMQNNITLLEALITYSADLREGYCGYLTPILRAVKDVQIPVIKLLLKAGVDTTGIVYSLEYMDVVMKTLPSDLIQLLLQSSSANCDAALYAAVTHCRTPIVKFLLDMGANPNFLGDTILYIATKSNAVDIVRILVGCGQPPVFSARVLSSASDQVRRIFSSYQ